MTTYRILFAGPMGAGKRSAITAVSDVPPTASPLEFSGESRRSGSGYAVSTFALDQSVIKLGERDIIRLLAAPGDEQAAVPWEALGERAIGMVLILDNSRPNPFHDLHLFITIFKQLIERTKIVVGITRTDQRPYPGIADYHRQLYRIGVRAPVFEIDAHSREDVSLLLQALLYLLDPGIEA